jgi:hypothetical protein
MTDRQFEVVQLMARRLTPREIAQQLKVHRETVYTWRQAIGRTLGKDIPPGDSLQILEERGRRVGASPSPQSEAVSEPVTGAVEELLEAVPAPVKFPHKIPPEDLEQSARLESLPARDDVPWIPSAQRAVRRGV